MWALGGRVTGWRATAHRPCSMGAALREEAYRGTSGSHDRAGEHFRKRKVLCSDLESEWGKGSGSPEFALGGFPSSRRAAESEAGFRFRTGRSVFRHRLDRN
jgi:hypothetical protein